MRINIVCNTITVYFGSTVGCVVFPFAIQNILLLPFGYCFATASAAADVLAALATTAAVAVFVCMLYL